MTKNILSILFFLMNSQAFAQNWQCISEEAATVAIGDSDQFRFTGEIGDNFKIQYFEISYNRLNDRDIFFPQIDRVLQKVYPKFAAYQFGDNGNCTYNLILPVDYPNLAEMYEAQVELFCPGEIFDQEYISTLKLKCQNR